MHDNPDHPYPHLTDAQKAWFNGLLEGMVKDGDGLNWYRVKNGNDLELAIKPTSPEDGEVFTDGVCAALEIIVGQVTGVPSPVIYLKDKPNQRAVEARKSALFAA